MKKITWKIENFIFFSNFDFLVKDGRRVMTGLCKYKTQLTGGINLNKTQIPILT